MGAVGVVFEVKPIGITSQVHFVSSHNALNRLLNGAPDILLEIMFVFPGGREITLNTAYL